MSLPFKEISESALDAIIASERNKVVAPLTEWRTLSKQLREEGLLKDSRELEFANQSSDPARYDNLSSTTQPVVYRSGPMQWGRRALAAVFLLGAGVLVGRTSGGTIGLPAEFAHAGSDSASQAELVTPTDFSSSDEALRVLNRAQAEYQQAVAYLAVRNDTRSYSPDLSNLRERLAALDAVVSAAQSAVEGSPDDPVLNQYYMSTSGARRATMQMINQTLPSGTRLAGF